MLLLLFFPFSFDFLVLDLCISSHFPRKRQQPVRSILILALASGNSSSNTHTHTHSLLVSVEMTPLSRINMAVTLTGSWVFKQLTHTHTPKFSNRKFASCISVCLCGCARIPSHSSFVSSYFSFSVSRFFLYTFTHPRSHFSAGPFWSNAVAAPSSIAAGYFRNSFILLTQIVS